MAWMARWLCEYALALCSRITELNLHLHVAFGRPDLPYYRYLSDAYQSVLYNLHRPKQNNATHRTILEPQNIAEFLPLGMLQCTHEQWLLKSFRSLQGVEKLVITGGQVDEEDVQDLRKVVTQQK